VGTVEKRSLFFHGFHSPDFCLAVSFSSVSGYSTGSRFS
jgi:hypothetical protein